MSLWKVHAAKRRKRIFHELPGRHQCGFCCCYILSWHTSLKGVKRGSEEQKAPGEKVFSCVFFSTCVVGFVGALWSECVRVRVGVKRTNVGGQFLVRYLGGMVLWATLLFLQGAGFVGELNLKNLSFYSLFRPDLSPPTYIIKHQILLTILWAPTFCKYVFKIKQKSLLLYIFHCWCI